MLSKLLKILFPYVLLMMMLSTILFDDVETVGVAVLLCHVVDFTVPNYLAADVAVPRWSFVCCDS